MPLEMHLMSIILSSFDGKIIKTNSIPNYFSMISLASTAKVVKELVIPAQMQFAIPDLTFVLILCAAHLEALPLA